MMDDDPFTPGDFFRALRLAIPLGLIGLAIIAMVFLVGCTTTDRCTALCEARCAEATPRPPIVSTELGLCGCACQ